MFRTNIPGCALALALLLTANPAAAQGETNDDLAKKYYKLGSELYSSSNYEDALELFKKSYSYSRRHALLYNMGRCHEGLGQHAEAVDLYERFLKHAPPNEAQVRARIANLKRLIKKREEQPKPGPSGRSAPDIPRPLGPEEKIPSTQRPEAKPQPKPEPVIAPKPEPGPERDRGPLWIPGWVAGGTGVALIGAGVVLGLLASDKADDVEKAHNDSSLTGEEAQSLIDQGETYDTAAVATWIAGGVVLAAGVAMLVLDLTGTVESERSAWIAPAPLPGGAVVGAGVSF